MKIFILQYYYYLFFIYLFIFLCRVLASLNLPAALEDTSGEVVPQSLVEKSVAVSSMGGLSKLDSMISELPELLQRNTDILNEVLSRVNYNFLFNKYKNLHSTFFHRLNEC